MTKVWQNGDIIHAEDMNRLEEGVDELYVTITNNESAYVMDKTYNEIKTAKRVYINGSIYTNAVASSCVFAGAYDANELEQTPNHVTVIYFDSEADSVTVASFLETNGVLTLSTEPV